jgi:hypothetical protein
LITTRFCQCAGDPLELPIRQPDLGLFGGCHYSKGTPDRIAMSRSLRTTPTFIRCIQRTFGARKDS